MALSLETKAHPPGWVEKEKPQIRFVLDGGVTWVAVADLAAAMRRAGDIQVAQRLEHLADHATRR